MRRLCVSPQKPGQLARVLVLSPHPDLDVVRASGAEANSPARTALDLPLAPSADFKKGASSPPASLARYRIADVGFEY